MLQESALAQLEWRDKSQVFALKIEDNKTRSAMRCTYGEILGRTGSIWKIRVIFYVERTNGSNTVDFQQPSGKDDQEIKVEDGDIKDAEPVKGSEEGLKKTVQEQQGECRCSLARTPTHGAYESTCIAR